MKQLKLTNEEVGSVCLALANHHQPQVCTGQKEVPAGRNFKVTRLSGPLFRPQPMGSRWFRGYYIIPPQGKEFHFGYKREAVGAASSF